jgi:hypothetical protein
MRDETSTTSLSYNHITLKEEREYFCPKHGNVSNSIMDFEYKGDIEKNFKRTYCFFCYDEFMQKNVTQPVRVTKSEDEEGG